MNATIKHATVKGLTYKAGVKDDDPAAVGRLVIEFDAEDASAAELAALIGQAITVDLRSPQMEMVGLRSAVGVGADA